MLSGMPFYQVNIVELERTFYFQVSDAESDLFRATSKSEFESD